MKELLNTNSCIPEDVESKNFTKETAISAVEKMHHNDIAGELICIEDVAKYHGEQNKWDAYVAYNYSLHIFGDYYEDEDVFRIAEIFWFYDCNYNREESKVWWYYTNECKNPK